MINICYICRYYVFLYCRNMDPDTDSDFEEEYKVAKMV